MRINTGTYTGNGSAGRVISGVGFQPDVVMIKASNSNEAVWKFSTMPATSAKAMGNGDLQTNQITGLNSDGFVVGNASNVNGSLVTYRWFALEVDGVDSNVISYSGNGADDRSITGVGFQPDLVVIIPEGITARTWWRTVEHPAGESQEHNAANVANAIQAFEADGFQVGTTTVNSVGATYHALCLAKVAGSFNIVEYTGNATDNRDIAHGLGSSPLLALILSQTSAQQMVGRFSLHVGDLTSLLPVTSAADFANAIQAMDATNVQVGTHARVNTSAETYTLMTFSQSPFGSGAPLLPSLLSGGAGEQAPAGQGLPTLPSLISGGGGTLQPEGVGATSLAALLAAVVGVMQPEGIGAGTLPGLTSFGRAVSSLLSGQEAPGSVYQPGGPNIDCAVVDFAVNGHIFAYQPVSVRMVTRQNALRRMRSGWHRGTRQMGRRFVIQWGETALLSDAVAEIRQHLAPLNLTVQWVEPDGSMRLANVLRGKLVTQWSQTQRGFYYPVIVELFEREDF